MLEAHSPRTIAVDAHPEIAFASGLHAGEHAAMTAALGARWTDRFVVKPMLAVEYIGTQIDARLAWYRRMQETAWAIIATAFSEAVITPGKTTTGDVEWWMREQIQALNYTTWFHPSVTVIREDMFGERAPPAGDQLHRITYGDLLHVDFGVTALGMNTDTQHLGYVLQPGQTEDDVPRGLREGLKKGNRLQDMTRKHMKPGKSGNEILKSIRAQMKDEGIDGLIYCHAIGDWGHSAGTVIGRLSLHQRHDAPPQLTG